MLFSSVHFYSSFRTKYFHVQDTSADNAIFGLGGNDQIFVNRRELTVYVVAVAMTSSAAMASSLVTVVTTSLAALMITTSTALTSLWMTTNYMAETISVATPTKVNQTLKQIVKSRSFTPLFS
jgi:hypothetical protein